MASNGERSAKKAERDQRGADATRIRQKAAYQTIDALKHRFPISWLCRVLEISRASYYKWIHRKAPQYEIDDQTLTYEIEQIFTRSHQTYGYRRVYIYLRLIRKIRVNHKRVYRLMDQMGWKAVIRRKSKRYVRATPQMTAENILNRQFNATGPNQKWVTDVTEFKLTTGQKAYLSAIYDLGSGRIVSHVLGRANNNLLVFETFRQAEQTTDARDILLHSDRGFQYTSRAFQKRLRDRGFISSMSRVGRCIDNGPMEGVWSIIKCEMYHLRKYETFDALKTDIDRFITFFNTERITLKMAQLI